MKIGNYIALIETLNNGLVLKVYKLKISPIGDASWYFTIKNTHDGSVLFAYLDSDIGILQRPISWLSQCCEVSNVELLLFTNIDLSFIG